MKIRLKNGKLVDLKLADRTDLTVKALKYMYKWSNLVDTYTAMSFPPAKFNSFKAMLLSRLNEKYFVVLLALDGDLIVGYVTLTRRGGLFFHRTEHVGGFLIIVHPDYQGKGLGTAMLTEIERIAKNIGILKIEITVVAKNSVALHIYEKLGYSKEGLHVNSRRLDDGQLVDVLSLGKEL